MIPEVIHNLARQSLTCWAFLFYTNMIYSRVTKVKTRSGFELLVKEQDLEIRNSMNENIVIELTVLIFPILIKNEGNIFLQSFDNNYKDHPSESTQYFHRDEIAWFKNQWL